MFPWELCAGCAHGNKDETEQELRSMLWVLVIVSIFAARFAGWLTLLARANARRFPVPEPEEMLKKDADAMLIVLPALIAISSS